MTKLLLSPRTIFPVIAGAILILAVLACGAGAPSESSAPTASIPSLPSTPASPIPTIQPQPAILERRFLTLEYPPRIRAGDSDRIRLTLEVDDLGNITPTAVIGGNVVTGEVIEVPNLYETHRVIVEAKFDIAGLEVSPPGLSSQTLEQGQSVTFFWSVRPEEAGIYRGTVWLYLRFVDKVSGDESRKTVSAHGVEIEAVNFFGISVHWARTLGVTGSVIGTIIGFPFFEDIVKFVLKRRKNRT